MLLRRAYFLALILLGSCQESKTTRPTPKIKVDVHVQDNIIDAHLFWLPPDAPKEGIFYITAED